MRRALWAIISLWSGRHEGLPVRWQCAFALTVFTKAPNCPVIARRGSPSDSQIWDFARKHDLVIVSKDTDFSDRIITNTPPPREVHLRLGNLRRNEYHRLLARRWPQIESLLKTNKLVNVYIDRLEGIG